MTVSILGCGWLGFPLAQYLLNEDLEIKGSTTSSDKLSILQQSGIETYLIKLPDDFDSIDSQEFWNTDILFINIPPIRGKRDVTDSYPELIEKIVQKAEKSNISRILFASSTSVYSETGGVTTEDHAEPGLASRPSGEAILKAENVIKSSGIDYVILRFGGLYGYDRHPVKYLSGKSGLKGILKPVNLVHQSDCVKAVNEVIKQNRKNEIYNVVSDGHPPRGEFYRSAAEHFDLPVPVFEKPEKKNYRVISNQKLKDDLGFSFCYPNPMDHTP